MPKGRANNFNIKSTEPKLFAIVQMPDGSLQRREVKRDRQTTKKYDAYVKGLQGLYVPASMRQYLHQPKGDVKE